MSQEPKSPAPFSEVVGEALKQPQENVCPYCVSSQKHAIRHTPEVAGSSQLGYVRCLPHRLLQPVTQYLADFAREATTTEKFPTEKTLNIPLVKGLVAYGSGAFFGQNPLTLLSKVEEVEWDPYALAPTDATLWGTVIAYLPISLKGDKARGWTFYVLLSADYERGEYENRRLGVAFFVTSVGWVIHPERTPGWGYLPDPHVALALASCVGWQHLCVVHGTCTMNAINHSHEEFAPDVLADLPPYVQREDCEKCRPSILP